jgi:hypothetical protein
MGFSAADRKFYSTQDGFFRICERPYNYWAQKRSECNLGVAASEYQDYLKLWKRVRMGAAVDAWLEEDDDDEK